MKLPLVLLEEVAQVNWVWDTLLKIFGEKAGTKINKRFKYRYELQIINKVFNKSKDAFIALRWEEAAKKEQICIYVDWAKNITWINWFFLNGCNNPEM